MLVPGLIKLGNSGGAPCVDMCGHYEETDFCCLNPSYRTSKPLTEYQTINFWMKPCSGHPLYFNYVPCYDQLNFYNIHLIKEQNDVTVFINGENIGRYPKSLPNNIGALIHNVCSHYTGGIVYTANIRIIDNDVVDITSFVKYKFNSVMNKKYTGNTPLTYHFKFENKTNLGENSVGDNWNISGEQMMDIPWDNCYTLNPYTELRERKNGPISGGNLYSSCDHGSYENYKWNGLPKKGKYFLEIFPYYTPSYRSFAMYVNNVIMVHGRRVTLSAAVDHENNTVYGYAGGNLQSKVEFKDINKRRMLWLNRGTEYRATINFGQRNFVHPVENFPRLSAKNLSCDDIETEGEFNGYGGHFSPGRLVHTNCNFETLTIDGTEFYNDGTRNPHVRFFSWGFKLVHGSPFNSGSRHTWSGIVKNNWNCNNGEYVTS